MYVLTNGDGYIFHKDDGTHILNEDELPEVFEEVRQISTDDFPIFVYRLIAADDDLVNAFEHVSQGTR